MGRCTFLPGSTHKRVAKSIGGMPLSAISPPQWAYVMRLAWRYRRQMPAELVPLHAAVKALDAWRPRPARQIGLKPSAAPRGRIARHRLTAADVRQMDIDDTLRSG